MKSHNRLQIHYHLSSKGQKQTKGSTSTVSSLLKARSSLPEKKSQQNLSNRNSYYSSNGSPSVSNKHKAKKNASKPKVVQKTFKVGTGKPTSGNSNSNTTGNSGNTNRSSNGNSQSGGMPKKFYTQSGGSNNQSSSPEKNRTSNNQSSNSQSSNNQSSNNQSSGARSSGGSVKPTPKKKMVVNRESAQTPKKVVDSGRTGLFHNERSTTYRRDFIKANPPFLGKWYLCSLCFKPVSVQNMQVDHIFPVSKGGSNSTKNLGPLCGPCNRDKSNKVDSRIIQMFIIKMGGNALGVPISIAYKGVTTVGKYGFKATKFVAKGLFGILPKLLGTMFTGFMSLSFKSKLLLIAVCYFIYATYI